MGRTELSRRGRALARCATLLALLGALLPASAVASSTPVDLTANASTILAASMNPGVVDAFGKPYAVKSRVTAVRFHDGTTASTAPGGLGPAPHPRLQRRNGVRFYEVTGELSGIGHSSVGFEYVYGPIDANGVDQSRNGASPRYGLPGIAFRLVYPASGWNGHLIVFRPGGDGGQGSGHYLYQAITDELTLVRRGYAYFVTLGGGTTPPDSNPASSTGRFWKLGPPGWDPDGPPHPAYFRPARIGADWSESLITDAEAGRIWVSGNPAPSPLSSSTSLGDLPVWTQEDVPTFRDHINVAKNLLQLLQGARPSETGVVTWSRSGVLAIGMNTGRTAQLPPTAIVPSASNPDTFQALTPRTGGNYNTPYVPGSGTVADWFVVRSGVEAAFIPQPPDGEPQYFDTLPDPDYPVSAPMTYIIGEIDHPDIFINGYYLANAIAAALPGSKLQDKDINSWLRLYTLRGATHSPREAWFAGTSDGGGKTWFEPGVAGYNHKGRGLELPAWADALRANNPGIDLDWMGIDYAATLPEEGFALQAIANAERWAKTGSPPPTSAVDANLVTNPTPSTLMVTYPVAEDCTAEAIFGAGDLSCLQSLQADSVINDPDAGLGELDPYLIDMLQTFAAGPLRTTTLPIDLPGNAAPLGFRLFTQQPVWERPFTRKELKARYGTHAGYVAAVARAVAALVARKLYDPVTGADDIAAAARSPVLR